MRDNRDIQRTGDFIEAMKREDIYTIEDIYALPDGERAELIDGKIYDMAPPSLTHQRLVSRLNQKIANYIDTHHGDCEVFPSPFAVFLSKDQFNYVEPDFSVVCDSSKLDEKGCHGAPDWVIEIVSPGSKNMDYYTKLFKYRNAGVREYWIVDPIKKQVIVYRFEQETMEEYSFEEDVPVGIYGGFSINVQ